MVYTESFVLFHTKEMVTNRDVIRMALPAIKVERNGFQVAGNTEHEMCKIHL